MDTSYPFQYLLVVDDNPIDRLILTRLAKLMFLSENIHAVTSGQEALDYLAACRDQQCFPQLILLDLLMPEMDGYQFMDKAEVLGLLAGQPVSTIMVTCSILPSDEAPAAQYPLAGYLHKPLTPEGLRKVLQPA